MPMHQPLISIITPCFNGEAYLRQTLQSVQAQEFEDWEHIVLDNCSTDRSMAILAEFDDPRRIVVSEPDTGQSDAINKGLARARGRIHCWLNADDQYADPRVLSVVATAFARGDCDVAFGLARWRYEPSGDEKPVWIDASTSNMGARFERHIGICQPAVFWRGDVLSRSSLLNESLHYAMDFDLWCRMANAGLRWVHLAHTLAVHRVHAEMKTVKQRGRSLIETLLVLKMRFGVASEPWLDRAIAYYAQGVVGLQDDAAALARPALDDAASSWLHGCLTEVFGRSDVVELRLHLAGYLNLPAGSRLVLRRALEDIVRCSAPGVEFARRDYDDCLEVVEQFLSIDGWRQLAPPVVQMRSASMQAPSLSKQAASSIAALEPIRATPLQPASAATGTLVSSTAPTDVFGFHRLLRFKDRYAGRQCVLLCNGPSLRDVDFSLIRDEFLIGLNKIYLGTDLIGRLPNIVVCVNKKVLEQSTQQFQDMGTLKLLGNRAGLIVPQDPLTFYFNSSDPKAPRFALDIVKHVHEGWTVTHAALQIAFYAGFRKVVIVGMDHNFPDAQGKPNEAQRMDGADRNHFAPGYFGFGQQWDLPDLRNSEISYAEARRQFEGDGRLVVDATEAGHCRVFERLPLREALALPIPATT